MIVSFRTLTLPEIQGKIYYGFCPNQNDLDELKHLNVEVVWNLAAELTETYSLEKKTFPNVEFSGIEDFSIPTSDIVFNRQFSRIIDFLNEGKSIFVHCLGGHGRTGIALSLILIKVCGITVNEALEKTYQLCRGPEMDEQKEFVKSFSEKYL